MDEDGLVARDVETVIVHTPKQFPPSAHLVVSSVDSDAPVRIDY